MSPLLALLYLREQNGQVFKEEELADQSLKEIFKKSLLEWTQAPGGGGSTILPLLDFLDHQSLGQFTFLVCIFYSFCGTLCIFLVRMGGTPFLLGTL